jgi:hypothetical protein
MFIRYQKYHKVLKSNINIKSSITYFKYTFQNHLNMLKINTN